MRDAWELVIDALREIRAHKLRSLLTLSGIVFGTASVVSMTSLASAMKTLVYDDLMAMGFPRSFTASDRGPRSDARTAATLRHTGVRLIDVEALRAVPGVASVHGRNFGQEYVVNAPADRRRVRIDGVDAGYLELRNYRITAGRSLRPLDVANRARVAVVGSELVHDLFGAVEPVGQTITIDGVRFLVVGVVAPIEFDIIPADFTFVARRIYVPYTYLTRYYQGEGRVDQVLVTAAPTVDFGGVLRRGVTLLRQRHGGTEDFEIDNEAADVLSDLAMADNILGGWNAVMFTIAGVTLVVGGIGLFSVLLISVRERVREIGIRKALGADDGAVLRLFLAESLTLAFLGAVVGIGGGAGLTVITELIGRQFGKPFVIPVNVPGVFLAVLFALIVGVLFGWYPARRAARLDPIEAIEGV
ncbi:MAG TPA: ABC transporter permease [Gemmatimonadales bacterium]|jgi:putative ABC transport system permease protein|nr:ABC transporter permease [Gemmatimonadales bacterium]